MKIETLTLKNWRNHKSLTLECDRVCVIRGPNASGKSSIAMAIEYLVTGRCEVTADGGVGSEQLVMAGAKQAAVEGEFAGGLNVIRSRSQAGGNLILTCAGKADASGGTPSINLAGREASKWMVDHGWSPDLLSVVLRGARFLDLPSNEQQRILASVVEPQIIEIPQEILDLAAIAGCGTQHRLSSVKEAEVFRSVFYARRTEMSQAIAALGKPEPPPIADVPDLNKTQDKLASLEREWRGMDDAAAATLQAYMQACERRETAQADLGELVETPESQSKVWDAVIQQRNNCASTATQRSRLTEDLRRATEDWETAKKARSTCPTCKQAIAEKTRNYFIEEAGGRVGKLKTELTTLPVPPDPEALRSAEAGRAAAMRAVTDRAALEKILAEPAPVEPDLHDAPAKMEALQERIAKGRAVIEKIVEYRAKQKAYETAEENRAKLQARHDACGKLVEYFGPSGVQAQIVGERVGAMVETLRAKMAYWGFDVNLSMDPYGFTVNGLAPGQLSASERFRFAVALQVTLAQLTGIALVVIDAADVLTLDLRRKLAQMVMDSTLDQAFIFSTADEKGNAQDGPMVKFFWLGA